MLQGADEDRVGHCRTEDPHEDDRSDLRRGGRKSCQQEEGQQYHGRGALLIQAHLPARILRRQRPVHERHDGVGQAPHHPPDHSHGGLIPQGEFRNGDEDPYQHDDGQEHVLQRQPFLVDDRLQEGHEQGEGGKGDGTDGHGGDLDGLEKGGPVDRHHDPRGDDEQVISPAVQPDPFLSDRHEDQQKDKGKQHPAEGDGYCGPTDEFPDHASQPE